MTTAQRKADYEAAFGPRRLKPVSMQPTENIFTYGARCIVDGDSDDRWNAMERLDMGFSIEAKQYRSVFGETHAFDFRDPNTTETIAYSYLLADAMRQTGDL